MAITKRIDRITLGSNKMTIKDEVSCKDCSQTQKRANVIAMIRRDFLVPRKLTNFDRAQLRYSFI